MVSWTRINTVYSIWHNEGSNNHWAPEISVREGLLQYNLGVRIMSVYYPTQTLFRSESPRDRGPWGWWCLFRENFVYIFISIVNCPKILMGRYVDGQNFLSQNMNGSLHFAKILYSMIKKCKPAVHCP